MSFEDFRAAVRLRMGVNPALAKSSQGLGCLGLVGGFVFLFLFWPLGFALLLIAFLFLIVDNQRSGSERAAMAVADAEALRLWEERKRRQPTPGSQDPLFRAAQRLLTSLEESLAVGERLPPGLAKFRRTEEADRLLEELFVICQEIAFLSQTEAEELEWRLDQLKASSSVEESAPTGSEKEAEEKKES